MTNLSGHENRRLHDVGSKLAEDRNWSWNGSKLMIGNRAVGRVSNQGDALAMLDPRYMKRAIRVLERVHGKLVEARLHNTAASATYCMLLLIAAQPQMPGHRQALEKLDNLQDNKSAALEFALTHTRTMV